MQMLIIIKVYSVIIIVIITKYFSHHPCGKEILVRIFVLYVDVIWCFLYVIKQFKSKLHKQSDRTTEGLLKE